MKTFFQFNRCGSIAFFFYKKKERKTNAPRHKVLSTLCFVIYFSLSLDKYSNFTWKSKMCIRLCVIIFYAKYILTILDVVLCSSVAKTAKLKSTFMVHANADGWNLIHRLIFSTA